MNSFPRGTTSRQGPATRAQLTEMSKLRSVTALTSPSSSLPTLHTQQKWIGGKGGRRRPSNRDSSELEPSSSPSSKLLLNNGGQDRSSNIAEGVSRESPKTRTSPAIATTYSSPPPTHIRRLGGRNSSPKQDSSGVQRERELWSCILAEVHSHGDSTDDSGLSVAMTKGGEGVQGEPDENELDTSEQRKKEPEKEGEGKSTGGGGDVPVVQRKKRTPVVIDDHITTLGGNPQLYQCNVCQKKFRTKSHIKYHKFCILGGAKPFKCGQCGQGFIAKSHYEYHLRTHTGERPYVCPTCGKGFNQRGRVTRHLRTHTGEKRFLCQEKECGRGFTSAEALRTHTLNHSGERPYECTYCCKRFTTMPNLKKHVTTHTGEKPFICSHCGKCFCLQWTLDLHLRTHSSERPYPCNQCSTAFSSSKDLRRHLVNHTGERPFKCWICGSAFRRKDNLDRHIKNSHNQPKDVSKRLANDAAAEYLKNNSSKESPVNIPNSKINSVVISNILDKNADLLSRMDRAGGSASLATTGRSSAQSATSTGLSPSSGRQLSAPITNDSSRAREKGPSAQKISLKKPGTVGTLAGAVVPVSTPPLKKSSKKKKLRHYLVDPPSSPPMPMLVDETKIQEKVKPRMTTRNDMVLSPLYIERRPTLELCTPNSLKVDESVKETTPPQQPKTVQDEDEMELEIEFDDEFKRQEPTNLEVEEHEAELIFSQDVADEIDTGTVDSCTASPATLKNDVAELFCAIRNRYVKLLVGFGDEDQERGAITTTRATPADAMEVEEESARNDVSVDNTRPLRENEGEYGIGQISVDLIPSRRKDADDKLVSVYDGGMEEEESTVIVQSSPRFGRALVTSSYSSSPQPTPTCEPQCLETVESSSSCAQVMSFPSTPSLPPPPLAPAAVGENEKPDSPAAKVSDFSPGSDDDAESISSGNFPLLPSELEIIQPLRSGSQDESQDEVSNTMSSSPSPSQVASASQLPFPPMAMASSPLTPASKRQPFLQSVSSSSEIVVREEITVPPAATQPPPLHNISRLPPRPRMVDAATSPIKVVPSPPMVEQEQVQHLQPPSPPQQASLGVTLAPSCSCCPVVTLEQPVNRIYNLNATVNQYQSSVAAPPTQVQFMMPQGYPPPVPATILQFQGQQFYVPMLSAVTSTSSHQLAYQPSSSLCFGQQVLGGSQISNVPPFCLTTTSPDQYAQPMYPQVQLIQIQPVQAMENHVLQSSPFSTQVHNHNLSTPQQQQYFQPPNAQPYYQRTCIAGHVLGNQSPNQSVDAAVCSSQCVLQCSNNRLCREQQGRRQFPQVVQSSSGGDAGNRNPLARLCLLACCSSDRIDAINDVVPPPPIQQDQQTLQQQVGSDRLLQPQFPQQQVPCRIGVEVEANVAEPQIQEEPNK